jgi:protein TonB
MLPLPRPFWYHVHGCTTQPAIACLVISPDNWTPMDSYLDREFDQLPEPDAPAGFTLERRFVRMVVASIVLHIILSTPFFIDGRWSSPPPAVPLVDLSLVQQPSSPAAAAPPQQEMVEPVPAQPAAPAAEQQAPPVESHEQAPVADTTPALPEQTSFGLGMSRGYFKSIADGQTLRPDIRDYYFAMLKKINDSWWAHGTAQARNGVVREPVIDVLVARNGEIVRKALLKSSGNPAYDREILSAVDAASPLPALPESYGGDFFEAPVRLVAPRGLMLGSGLF